MWFKAPMDKVNEIYANIFQHLKIMMQVKFDFFPFAGGIGELGILSDGEMFHRL